jgi:peroxiredoxin (alkyl hydroperoxide reductase subunit C)
MIAYCGLFLIDKEEIVQHALVNNLPLARNVDEVIRTLDALRHFEENGEVCLANGQERSKAMTSSFKGVATYLSDN